MEEGNNFSSYVSLEKEEVEPKLRYERLKNDVPLILEKDAASCLAVHTKFLALGTHSGVIHILDHQGNSIRGKELILHTSTVNQISIDEKGDYIASCSSDGRVSLYGMHSSELDTFITIDNPARSVSLDPKFSKTGSHQRFIIGENKVVLYEKSYLAIFKSNLLHRGEGPIRNIQWKDDFVIWASDKFMRLFDLNAYAVITVIKRDFDPVLRPDFYRCNIFWRNKQTFIIGWGNTVKVCNIVSRENEQLKMKSYPCSIKFYVEITFWLNTDFCVCGISSMENDIVVLSTIKYFETHKNTSVKPQLKIFQSGHEDFKIVANDLLSLHGYQECYCNDYFLGSLTEEDRYFILSPKDIIVASSRDLDDHVDWLIQHNQFKESLSIMKEERTLRRHTLLTVGQLCIDYLVQSKSFDEAAELCSEIFGSDKQLWEKYIYKFAQMQQLRSVAPYLLTIKDLDRTIYENTLNEFLLNDTKGFLSLILTWPCHLYNIPIIINAVCFNLIKNPCRELYESLCELYIFNGNYDKALDVYIEIKHKDKVFDLIQNHNLFENVCNKIDILLELNLDITSDLLLNHMDIMPVDFVVSQLSSKPKLLFEYLLKIIQKDLNLCRDHHELLVELYAEYLPDELITFLRRSNNYTLDHAYDICQQRSLVPEIIFLLSRMGNTKQALQKIIFDLQDIEKAIQYCNEQNDEELWDYLIEYSLNKDFIVALLQNIGTFVDPIKLIQKIPLGEEIPRLKESVVKILQDRSLQIFLQMGYEKILVSDCFNLLVKLKKQHSKGILVDENQVCVACRRLLMDDFYMVSDIFVFNCSHAFHKECVPYNNACTICNTQKKESYIFQE